MPTTVKIKKASQFVPTLQLNAVKSKWENGRETPRILKFGRRLEVCGQIHSSNISPPKKLPF
jgi:hypothetical protein